MADSQENNQATLAQDTVSSGQALGASYGPAETKIDAETFLQGTRTADDAAHHSMAQYLNPKTLKYMVDNGQLVRIDKSELDPAVASQGKDGKDIPIYVVPGIGSRKNTTETLTFDNGEQAIVANEGVHTPTVPYVQDHLMTSKARIDKGIEMGWLATSDQFRSQLQQEAKNPQEYEAKARRFDSLIAAAGQDAQNMQVGDPRILIDNTKALSDEVAEARTGKEGGNYVVIDRNALEEALSSDAATKQFMRVQGHEVAHIASGDTTVKGIIASRDIALQRGMEERADLVGSGPLGSTDPQAAADFLRQTVREAYPDYMEEKHRGAPISDKPSNADLKAASDWMAQKDPDHPTTLDRAAALDDAAMRKGEYEANFQKENGHPVTTRDERAAESQWLTDKVMNEDMKGKWELPLKNPEGVAPPAGPEEKKHEGQGVEKSLNASQIQDIEGIRNSLAALNTQPVDMPRAPDARPQQDVSAGVQRS